MIKYEIIKYKSDGYGGTLSEVKTINKSELEKHLKLGWVLNRKNYFIVTDFINWWKPLTVGNKIAIFAILVPVLMAYILRDSINIAVFPKSDSDLKTINSDSLTTDYNQEVNSDTINYKPNEAKTTETDKRPDCELETLFSINSILEKGTELNDRNYTVFFENMNPECSNNSEYSEFSNELIYKTLKSNPKKFVAFLSKVSKKKEILEFVLTQLRNPIHDGIKLNEIDRLLDKTETENVKTKELVSESIKKAIEKYN